MHDRAHRPDAPAPRWPWIAGGLGAIALLGPLLFARRVIGLDLVALDELQVPSSLWGAGATVPRRGLWLVPASALSHVIPGGTVVVIVLAIALVLAFVGVEHLARPAPSICRAGAGVLYGLGPFMATRIGVGHVSLVLAAGLLPWALTTLLHPGADLRRTFRWSLALALTGPMGGALALVALLAGIMTSVERRLVAATTVVAGQLPWLLPAAIVALHTRSGALTGSATFATHLANPADVLSLVAGRGFWAATAQVGPSGWFAVALGAAFLGIAIAGRSTLQRRQGSGPLAAAALASVVIVASAVPGLRGPWGSLTSHAPFALLREGQRLLPLVLVWAAPAAALGAARLAVRWPRALSVPAALGLVLAGPGLWGAGGGLRSFDVPSSWQEARTLVAAQPGAVAIAPFAEHVDLPSAGGRRVLDPLPELFANDVIEGTDVEPGGRATDALDDRQAAWQRALASTGSLAATADALGARWIAVLDGASSVDVRARLAADPALQLAMTGDGLSLFRVASSTTNSGAIAADQSPLWRNAFVVATDATCMAIALIQLLLGRRRRLGREDVADSAESFYGPHEAVRSSSSPMPGGDRT